MIRLLFVVLLFDIAISMDTGIAAGRGDSAVRTFGQACFKGGFAAGRLFEAQRLAGTLTGVTPSPQMVLQAGEPCFVTDAKISTWMNEK